MFLFFRAVNKWCVTGTPLNTSLKDIRGQLQFLGFQDTAQLFSRFSDQMVQRFSQAKKDRYSENDDAGSYIFLLRNIMMRHAIQMKSRAEERSIMSLPPKVNRCVIQMDFLHIASLSILTDHHPVNVFNKGGKGYHNHFYQRREGRIR